MTSPSSIDPDTGQFHEVDVKPLHLRLLRYMPTLLLLGLAVHPILPTLCNNFFLLFLALFGIVHLFFAHELTLLEELAFTLIFLFDATIVFSLVWGVAHPDRFTRLIDRISKRWDSLRRRSHDSQRAQAIVDQILNTWIALRRGGWRGSLMGTFLNTGFDLLTLYLLFMAAGYRVGFGVLVTGYGLPLLLGKVGFLPGGVGIVKGTMVALYTGLGVQAATAVVVVLAYRALSFWIPTLLGFPLVPFLKRSGRNQPVIRGSY